MIYVCTLRYAKLRLHSVYTKLNINVFTRYDVVLGVYVCIHIVVDIHNLPKTIRARYWKIPGSVDVLLLFYFLVTERFANNNRRVLCLPATLEIEDRLTR